MWCNCQEWDGGLAGRVLSVSKLSFPQIFQLFSCWINELYVGFCGQTECSCCVLLKGQSENDDNLIVLQQGSRSTNLSHVGGTHSHWLIQTWCPSRGKGLALIKKGDKPEQCSKPGWCTPNKRRYSSSLPLGLAVIIELIQSNDCVT